MTIANVVVGPVKQLNMHPLEALLVVILVTIQGQGPHTDHPSTKMSGHSVFYPLKRPQSGTTPCASKRSSDDYSGGHHMAVYFPGQQVVIAHPMKNHGTGPCTNKFIPDNGNWILQASQEKLYQK